MSMSKLLLVSMLLLHRSYRHQSCATRVKQASVGIPAACCVAASLLLLPWVLLQKAGTAVPASAQVQLCSTSSKHALRYSGYWRI
jgi:hypothetical protein